MSKPKGLKPIEQAYLDLFYVQNCLEQYSANGVAMPIDELRFFRLLSITLFFTVAIEAFVLSLIK